jgi:hypothetical protein
MSRERKLLIITGAMLIALIIAIAAFSLGVYVGVHGWTAGAPAVAGPGQMPPQAPGQGQPPPADRPGQPSPSVRDQAQPRPQLTGRIRSVSEETITLDTPQGPRLIQVAEDVQVFRRNQGQPREEPASLKQVVPGKHLAVYGYFEGDGGRRLIARRLVLLPPPPQQQP